MKISIVIPIFNEESNLDELYDRLGKTFEQAPEHEWTIWFVDDGSRDQSRPMLEGFRERDNRVHVVVLSRNFGHQAAISAGLSLADGDAVILMDGDLQDPPEVILDLVGAWLSGGRVIRAVRRSRKERGLRGLGFAVFHSLFSYISDFPIPANTGIFGLLDRSAVDELNLLKEKNRFLPGLRAWIGFDQVTVEYDRQDRASGQPKQTLVRLTRYALDGVFSFSYKPLRLMTVVGVFVSTVGFSLAMWFIMRRLLGIEIAETGFTTLVTLILFMGGLQLIAIGLLGEYLGRIYDEVKQRPLFIVDKLDGDRLRIGAENINPPSANANMSATVESESK